MVRITKQHGEESPLTDLREGGGSIGTGGRGAEGGFPDLAELGDHKVRDVVLSREGLIIRNNRRSSGEMFWVRWLTSIMTPLDLYSRLRDLEKKST